jgi:hypothetical protein
MSEPGKISASHLSRTAVIYVRQSTLIQVERNTESTARRYDLVPPRMPDPNVKMIPTRT